jgi:hypothetical protein
MATVHDGVREFMCFTDVQTRKTYIEEITGGSLYFIDDDALAAALAHFLTENKVLDMGNPMLPDEWLRHKPSY